MTTNLPIAFFLLFLVLCAGYGCQDRGQSADIGPINCVPCDCHTVKKRAEDQAWPTISSSSLFQNAKTDLTLQCNPAPGGDAYNSELIFSNDDSVLYNSTLKRENGVFRINATAIRFPSQNLYLSNLTCAYNNSLSSNNLNIPYLNIDEFQVGPTELKFNETSTVLCKVALEKNPENYTVRFLINQVSHFEFKHSNEKIFWFNLANSKFRDNVVLRRAGNLIVSKYPVYSAIFAIDVTPIWYDEDDYKYRTNVSNLLSTIQCELQYGENELMTVRSKKYPF